MSISSNRALFNLCRLIVVSTLLTGATGCQSRKVEFHMQQPQPVCFGRMRMVVPGPASIKFSHTEIDSVVLEWAQLNPGQTFTAAWQDRLHELSDDNSILSSEAPSPGRVAVISKTTLMPNPKLRDFETWQDYSPNVLKASGPFGQDQTEVAKHYIDSALDHFHVSDNLQPRPHDFCMEGGAVQVKTDYGDSVDGYVNIPLHSKAEPLETLLIDISTQVNTKSEPVTVFERDQRAMKEFPANGASYRVIRQGERTVAGLKGSESVILLRGVHGYNFSAEFEYGGEASRADAPYLQLVAYHDYPNTIAPEDVLALWDEVLQSIQFKL